MTQLHAQPYDISATGFYFDSAEEYAQKSAKNFNSYGAPVEEYEIQFIDGESIDAALFKALNIHQGNFPQFLVACDSWDDQQKQKVIIAVGECGYSFDLASGDPDDFDVDVYQLDSLKSLPSNSWTKACSAKFLHQSRTIWTMTPSPVTSAWTTAKSPLLGRG